MNQMSFEENTPRIWEAINSGDIPLLADMLYSDDRFSSPEAIARLLIENNERRKMTDQNEERNFDSPSEQISRARMLAEMDKERISKLEKLARDLYFAINDAYEFVDEYSDVVDGSEGIPRPNQAMHIIQEWKPLLERAERVLGLSRE